MTTYQFGERTFTELVMVSVGLVSKILSFCWMRNQEYRFEPSLSLMALTNSVNVRSRKWSSTTTMMK